MKVTCISNDNGEKALIVGKEYKVIRRMKQHGQPIRFLIDDEWGCYFHNESYFYISHRNLLEKFLMRFFKIY